MHEITWAIRVGFASVGLDVFRVIAPTRRIRGCVPLGTVGCLGFAVWVLLMLCCVWFAERTLSLMRPMLS